MWANAEEVLEPVVLRQRRRWDERFVSGVARI